MRQREKADRNPQCDEHGRQQSEPCQGQPEIAESAGEIVLESRKAAEAEEERETQQDGDAVGDTMQKALRGARDEGLAGAEFDGQP